jgi:uncharacterized protein YjiS (DUF1127 family)
MQLNQITRAAARSAQWVRNTIAFNKELNELNRMTDRELRDMGISRSDVKALAKNMREHPVGR